MSPANSEKPLRLVELGSSLGGLCIGQEGLRPRSRRLGMVSSVVQVMLSSTWARYRPKGVLQGQPMFSAKFTWKR